jgi:hypothetical protein
MLQAVAMVGVLGAARHAHAYCRTISVPTAIGYDPAQTGSCWTGGDAGSGVYLAWPARSQVLYSIVANGSVASNAALPISLDDATTAADLAFGAWSGASDAGVGPLCAGGSPNVQALNKGPVAPSVAATDCGLNTCADTVHDTQHLIVFRDTFWPHSDPVNTLALTTVTYGVITGTIYDSDTEINTFQHMVTTEEPPPPSGYPSNTYDLQSILTHEAGHFLGMAHAVDTSAVMYAYYRPGSVELQADDVAGICAIYPPLPPAGGSCELASGRLHPWAFMVGALGLCLVSRRRGTATARRR